MGPLNEFSATFSDSFAQPLKAMLPRTYSEGYGGSPRAFFNLLLTDPEGLGEECGARPIGAEDGTACAYAAFLTACFIIGIVFSVATCVYCTGFCIGRSCGDRCRCCCKLCGQANCGGPKPTQDYNKKQQFCCLIIFLVFWAVIMAIGILGFLSTNQMAIDMQDVITGMDQTVLYPEELSTQVNTTLDAIQRQSNGVFDSVNDRLTGRLIVNEKVSAFNSSLEAVIESYSSLKTYIEGQTTGGAPNPCAWNVNGTAVTWNEVGGYWQNGAMEEMVGTRCCSVQNTALLCVDGSHAIGLGSSINSRRPVSCSTFETPSGGNFTETSAACPCCCTCVERIGSLRMALRRMPSDAALEELNQPINTSTLGDTIFNAKEDVGAAIQEFDDTFTMFSDALQPAKDLLGNEAAIIGGAASVWALAWISMIIALVAFLCASAIFWWTSYCLGVLIVVVFFILFGVSSLIVLPFSDICTGMPVTNEDPSSWLLTFSTTNRIADVDPLLAALYTDCLVLTNPTGTLWSVAGLNEQNLTDKMDPYDVRKRLPDATVTRLLDAEANSAEFTTALPEMEADTEDRERVQVRLSASTLAALLAEGGPTSTQRAADWVAYQAAVDGRLADTRVLVDQAAAAQTALLSASSAVQANITAMKTETEAKLGAIVDDMWAAGDCADLNLLYEGVRRPMCDKLTKSLDSMWVLFFLMSVIWLPAFPVLCRMAKHSQQRRGISKVEDEDGEPKKKKKKKDKYEVGPGGEVKAKMEDGDGEKKEKKEGGPDPLAEIPVIGVEEGEKKKKKKKKKKDKGGDGDGDGGGGGGGEDEEERSAAKARKRAAK